MKNKKIIAMSTVLLVIMGCVGVYVYNQNNTENVMANTQQRDNKSMLPIVSVARETLSDSITGTGNTTAQDAEYVYPTYDGVVSDILVSVNDKIEAGDVILTYDVSDALSGYYRSIEEKQISMENANMDLELIYAPNNNIEQAEKAIDDLNLDYNSKVSEIEEAQSEIDLYKEYYEAGIESKTSYENKITAYDKLVEDLEKIETNIETANKNLQSATLQLENNYKQKENSIKLLQLDIDELNSDISQVENDLVSDISGTITNISSVEGKSTTLGQQVLEVINYDDLIVTSNVSEYDISEIYIGQPAQLYSDGNPDVIYKGEISYIGNEAVSTGEIENSVPIEIKITDENAVDLKAGFTLNIEMLTLNIPDVLTLDSTVIQKDEKGDSFVYITGEDKTINKQAVELGEIVGTKVVINSGLNENDKVISANFDLIVDGMSIDEFMETMDMNLPENVEPKAETETEDSGIMGDMMPPMNGGGSSRGGGQGGGQGGR